MTPVVISSEAELIEAVCARRDELELSHETIDDLAGLPDRYFSKLVGPSPDRGFGEMSLRSVLGALALGVAVVVLVEDPEQAKRMRPRWGQRRRKSRKSQKVAMAPFGCVAQEVDPGETQRNERSGCHEQDSNDPRPGDGGIPREASG
jgi:hypothetical protein